MSGASLGEALMAAGLWPAAGNLRQTLPPLVPGGDLLPMIGGVWNAMIESSPGQSAQAVMATAAAFRRAQEFGARLTSGVPGVDAERATAWLGNRLAWWPQGMPGGRRVGLVSSRLGQELEAHQAWFGVLRTACARLDPRRDLVVTAGQTATQRFVQRCGRLFGLPVLTIEVDRDEAGSWKDWGRRVRASIPDDGQAKPAPPARGMCGHSLAGASGFRCGFDTSPLRVLLSPPLAVDGPSAAGDDLADLPVPDRAILALSDRSIALYVRPKGNLLRLLRARLRWPGFPAASVFLALGPELVPRDLAGELLDAGGVGWYVINAAGEQDHSQPAPWTQGDTTPGTPAPTVPCPPADDWAYLTHCTRRRLGPWPDEDEDQFLDDLILDRAGADHSALAALWRIVRSGRLIASGEFVRGETPVVSLTAVPLSQIHRLRTYRSHLGRWDFEPYGICIRRDWLQRRGVRPVQYGDDSLWDALPAADRPFFQMDVSRTATGKRIDWTVEQEWRHVGDVELGDLPADAALLFVPSEAEARQLAAASPWPIVVLSS
ncbi:MAG TPA: hypothetical protein PLF81_30805 [Candidatus Anammoximicrobium sp.]|nr:hypothetical protein [Candidatus Anammoximicrobium sp.]